MNIDLTPELEALIQRKIAAGLYHNPSDVVREALQLLTERDRLREAHAVKLRLALADGLGQADRGEVADGRKVLSDVRKALRKRRSSNKRRK